MRYLLLFSLAILFSGCTPTIVGIEQEGYLMVEAEDFARQEASKVRKWHVVSTNKQPSKRLVDPDEQHHATASGQAYLEALPDTRVTHDDKLIGGTNFSNIPGKIAILSYPVRFNSPGRYYVWVRAYSTGSEDNGIHVGLDGAWPESGQRMQWCEGKNKWTWASKQRTQEVHCGVPELIYLDIPTAGYHTINFSLREDGFEFDAFVLSKEYVSPEERP
ncbi:MAG: hypothetical protein AAGA31_04935 [Bacteroidota bacterium]